MLLAAVLTLSLLSPATRPDGEATMRHFGEPMSTAELPTVAVGELLNNPQQFAGQTLRVTGTITKVCQHAGCWMELGAPAGTTPLFVKFVCPIEGRLIPKDAVGKDAIVEGTLTIKKIDEATARHYAEESGASEEQVQAIRGPQVQVSMQSPAALVVE